MTLRTKILASLAAAAGYPVDDLHAPMKGHPEFHRDPYHFQARAIAMQAAIVTGAIGKVLQK